MLVADRDALDKQDIFRCLRADTGKEIWSVRNPSGGDLDYGNSARATPLIYRDLVFFYNAFGRLFCVRLASGTVVWKKDLLSEFRGEDRANHWGTCSSPLVVDGKLIVNPGGPDASVVALDPESGKVIWKTPGDKAAFGSLIVATFGNHREIVGHERRALCGWNPATGHRIWRLVPPKGYDFNVPTPIAIGDKLLVSTENNGTRIYQFTDDGVIVAKPAATNDDLAPDTQTPVAVGNRVFGVCNGLHCLDAQSLHEIWSGDDTEFNDHAAAIACGDRVLIISKNGALSLIDAAADQYRLVSRQKIFDDDSGVLSHPAVVGRRLYLRGSDEIVCLDLNSPH